MGKFVNLFFVLVFIACAGLQYNDPDPYIWVPIYLVAAAICWYGAKQIQVKGLSIGALVVYVSYALYLFFTQDGALSWVTEHQAESLVQSMKATKPWIEQAREFGGLAIAVRLVSINMYWAKCPVAQTPSSEL